MAEQVRARIERFEDQSETVTMLNDMYLLAPTSLIDAPVSWSPEPLEALSTHLADARRIAYHSGMPKTLLRSLMAVAIVTGGGLKAADYGVQSQAVSMPGYPVPGSPATVTLALPGAEPRTKLRYKSPRV